MLRGRQQNERHIVIDSQNSCVRLSFWVGFKRQDLLVIASVVKVAEVSYITAEDCGIKLLLGFLLHCCICKAASYITIKLSGDLFGCLLVPLLWLLFFFFLTPDCSTKHCFYRSISLSLWSVCFEHLLYHLDAQSCTAANLPSILIHLTTPLLSTQDEYNRH